MRRYLLCPNMNTGFKHAQLESYEDNAQTYIKQLRMFKLGLMKTQIYKDDGKPK